MELKAVSAQCAPTLSQSINRDGFAAVNLSHEQDRKAFAEWDAERPQSASEGRSERLKAPALFLLDEFAALGRLEAVERAMGLMAGYPMIMPLCGKNLPKLQTFCRGFLS
ncbi:type IV secretory system conjugative DNA transfer family protein [Ruegeria atlantica]|uniref:type IV secretory system conjugative DNA transfer family protein n=1 Tax=Ruegeria atlantica TaxID=81569 RepID=UPI001C2BF947|nr:type IV secretory system conjugative DNA transfer family protein [Ruegeria atlantica]